MKHEGHRVNEYDWANFGRDFGVMEKMSWYNGAVTTIMLAKVWRMAERTVASHECDMSINSSQLWNFKMRWISWHIFFLESASDVIRKLTGIISRAMIPTCPSSLAASSFPSSAKKFTYGQYPMPIPNAS